MAAKRTPWFQKKESPARAGVYEMRCSFAGYHWSYYENGLWNGAWRNPAEAYLHRDWCSDMGDEGGATYLKVWRGLASDPFTVE